jgi:serine protease Do
MTRILIVLLGLIGGMAGAYLLLQIKSPTAETILAPINNFPIRTANQVGLAIKEGDFIEASKISTPAVVFIKTESEAQRRSSFWFFDFDPFGQIGKVSSTGSGVILSQDGYIVTNSHVVKNAQKIEVVLSQKKTTYEAKLIGLDPRRLRVFLIVINNLLFPTKSFRI